MQSWSSPMQLGLCDPRAPARRGISIRYCATVLAILLVLSIYGVRVFTTGHSSSTAAPGSPLSALQYHPNRHLLLEDSADTTQDWQLQDPTVHHNGSNGWQWNGKGLLALVLSTINSIVSAATGQGGTPILVPLFSALLDMTTSQAIAVAAFVTFLGSIPSLHHALTMKHPYRDDISLIDYTFLSLITPPLLLGIKAGAMVNAISPDWFTSFLLVIAYSWSTWKQLMGLMKYRRQETELQNAMKKVGQEVAVIEAATTATSPGNAPDPATVQQAMTALQQDIQKMSLLSRQLTQRESYNLLPHVLPRTTSSTVRTALDALWQQPPPMQRHAGHMGSRRHDDWDAYSDTLPGSTPGGMSPVSASPTYASAAPQLNGAAFNAAWQKLQPVDGTTALPPAPAAAAAAGGVLQRKGSMPLRFRFQHRQKSSLPRGASGNARAAAAAADAPFTEQMSWLESSLSFSTLSSMRRSFKSLRQHNTEVLVVDADAKQLVQLGQVLANASSVTGTLNRLQRNLTRRQTMLQTLVSQDISSDPQQLQLQQSLVSGHVIGAGSLVVRDAWTQTSLSSLTAGDVSGLDLPSSLAGPAAPPAVRPTVAASFRTGSLGPFAAAGVVPTVLRQETRALRNIPENDGSSHSLAVSLKKKLADADIEQGQGGKAAAAGQADKSKWTRLRQKLSWRNICADLSAWWQKQPKFELYLVLAMFLLYLALTSLTGVPSIAPKCSMTFWLIQAVFLAAVVALTLIATVHVWKNISTADAEQLGNEAAPAGKTAAAAVVTAGTQQKDAASSNPDQACDLTLHTAAVPQHPHTVFESFKTAISEVPASGADAGKDAGGVQSAAYDHRQHDQSGLAASTLNKDTALQQPMDDNDADAAVVVDSSIDEIQWTKCRLLYFPPVMFIVGLVSGLLGSSPNTLFLSPMLMALGCHPQVAAATLKLTLFVSSACSSLSYALQGQLILSNGLAFGIANLLTTPIGQAMMDYLIALTGRSSHIMVAAVAKNLVAIPMLVAFNAVPGVKDLIARENIKFDVSQVCA